MKFPTATAIDTAVETSREPAPFLRRLSPAGIIFAKVVAIVTMFTVYGVMTGWLLEIFPGLH